MHLVGQHWDILRAIVMSILQHLGVRQNIFSLQLNHGLDYVYTTLDRYDNGAKITKRGLRLHRIGGLGGKRGHADCGHANKKIPYVSAFSTLVENADTLENAQKMRKNVRIRKFLTCPHFPL